MGKVAKASFGQSVPKAKFGGKVAKAKFGGKIAKAKFGGKIAKAKFGSGSKANKQLHKQLMHLGFIPKKSKKKSMKRYGMMGGPAEAQHLAPPKYRKEAIGKNDQMRAWKKEQWDLVAYPHKLRASLAAKTQPRFGEAAGFADHSGAMLNPLNLMSAYEAASVSRRKTQKRLTGHEQTGKAAKILANDYIEPYIVPVTMMHP